MAHYRTPSLLLASISLCLALVAWGQDGGEPQIPVPPVHSRASEIHNACTREGVSVATVRQHADGSYEVVCGEGGDHARAVEIMNRVLATPAPGQTPVETLQEALVVLRFEPQNRAAQELVRKQYDELREKHLKSLKGK